jgi:hypothetical protein
MRIDRDDPVFVAGRRGSMGVALVRLLHADGELRGMASEPETV